MTSLQTLSRGERSQQRTAVPGHGPVARPLGGAGMTRRGIGKEGLKSLRWRAWYGRVEADNKHAKLTFEAALAKLESIVESDARSQFFHDYLCAKFSLNEKFELHGKSKSPYSYIHLLRAWGADSNGPAGAVLKSWVESRFGLVPIFHKAPLARFPSASWITYLQEKKAPMFEITVKVSDDSQTLTEKFLCYQEDVTLNQFDPYLTETIKSVVDKFKGNEPADVQIKIKMEW